MEEKEREMKKEAKEIKEKEKERDNGENSKDTVTPAGSGVTRNDSAPKEEEREGGRQQHWRHNAENPKPRRERHCCREQCS